MCFNRKLDINNNNPTRIYRKLINWNHIAGELLIPSRVYLDIFIIIKTESDDRFDLSVD